MVLVYVLTFGVYWWSMLPYIAYMDPMGHRNTSKPPDVEVTLHQTWFPGQAGQGSARREERQAWRPSSTARMLQLGVCDFVSSNLLGMMMKTMEKPCLYWNYRAILGIVQLKTCFFSHISPILSNYWTYFPQIFRRFLWWFLPLPGLRVQIWTSKTFRSGWAESVASCYPRFSHRT